MGQYGKKGVYCPTFWGFGAENGGYGKQSGNLESGTMGGRIGVEEEVRGWTTGR